MPRRPVLVTLCALAVLAGAGACADRPRPAANTSPPGLPTPQALPVTPGPDPITADFLADRTLRVTSWPAPVELKASPHPALQGTLAPLVVPSPDGNVLAYSTFTETVTLDPTRTPSSQGVAAGDVLGVPSVIVHDRRTGEERTLADGAYSPAWRPDGALAFVRGAEAPLRSATPYLGEVVVQPSLDGPAEPWSVDLGRYVVAAWTEAGLIVYHETGNESFDVEVITAPGDVRTLAAASSLLGLSPDRRLAAIASSANGRSSDVSILDIASGDVVASAATGPRTSLVYGGSWVGDRLVARGGDTQGSLLAVFDVGAGSLRLVQVLRPDARLPYGLAEPQLDRNDRNRLTAWSFVPNGPSGSYVLVRCDLVAASCAIGPPMTAKVVRLMR